MADEHANPGDKGQGNDDPKLVTEEQLNKAITARFKTFQTGLEKKIEEQISGLFVNSQEAVTKAIADAMPKETPTLAPKTDSPELAGLRKQMADLQKQSQQIAQERDEERKRSKDVELRQKLSDELSKFGVVNARHA